MSAKGLRGPDGWENWHAFERGLAAKSAIEVAFYTDSRIVGQVESLGPYSFLNPVPATAEEAGFAEIGLIMRADAHDDYEAPFVWEDHERPELGSYHGGTLGDEIASLISLALGVRMRSGGITRTFGAITNDPRGQPAEWEHRRPALTAPPRGRSSVLPRIAREANLEDAVSLLENYFSLAAKDATALVRAARGYERAVWGADDDPGLAWVALIGAVEVAAVHWRPSRHASALDELRACQPSLGESLGQVDEHVAQEIAKHLAPLLKSTARFRDFLEEFKPDPPEPRPGIFALDWSNLGEAFNEIYGRRSEALHAGTPIPWPMIYAPAIRENGAIDEMIGGLGASSGSAYWSGVLLPTGLVTWRARGEPPGTA
jgi:hypothetical protein